VCRSGAWIEAPEEVDELGNGELRIERRRLETHPDPRLERIRVAADVDPEDADFAAIGLAQSLEDLDGRGLARPVRPEESEDLALRDVEVDAVDGLHVAVSLGEATDADDGFGRGRDGHGCGRTGQSFFRRYAAIEAS
jgi:hypothetical protein